MLATAVEYQPLLHKRSGSGHVHNFINETWYSRYNSQLDEDLLTLIWSVIVSAFTVGGLLGNFIGGHVAVKIGRKKALLVNNVVAILAALFMGIAQPAGVFELLILGRFLIGLNAGVGMCVQPLYLGEIAPKRIRGLTSVGINIFLTTGIFTGQIIGLREVLGGENSWSLLLSSCAIPALIQLLTLPCFPESPRYLLIEKKDEYRCQKALKSFYGSHHFQMEMEDIQKESSALNGEKQKKILELFFDRSVKWQLITIIVTNIGQQLSGINAIYFYAQYVFKKTGIPKENIPYVTLGTGVCECITAMTCGLLIDRVGRRVLIIGGYSLMAFFCVVLTVSLTFQDSYPWVPYFSMAAILTFILSFGLGPGGVTNTLTAELFTQSARTGAYMIGGAVNWTSFFVIGMAFPFIVPPTKKLFLAVCAVGIGGSFQYGYNLSIINAPTTHVHKFINETWYSRYNLQLDEDLLTLIWSVIVSAFTIGGLLGTFIGGLSAVKLGRKDTLLVNNAVAIVAALFMGTAQFIGLFELLIVGRFMIGLNAGIGICVQPLYLGEIAPKNIRGVVTVAINMFLTAGILVGQIVGLREVLGGENSWSLLLSSCAIPAIIQLLTLPWFPESPRYLLIENKDDYRSIKALKSLYGSEHCQKEMEDIKKESRALKGEKQKKILELFFDQSIKWQLIAVIVTNIGQQLTGINAIYFYAEYVFKKTGIPTENIPYVTLGTGVCECITAMTCGLLIDRAGRRVLIIGGYSLMALFCVVLTVTLKYQDSYPWVPYLSMAAVLAFMLSFGLGPGGVTNTLTAELFTQSARTGAYMIGGAVNWTSFFAIGMAFPFIVNGLSQYCFLFFFVECISLVVFIYVIVPETKNKSFLEIKDDFRKLNFGHSYVLLQQQEVNTLD
ncbi:solute carrier family 2, facilitated glucose transporter member 11-like isoform X2 [Phyllobates terribilis]|uniref:solute carrier family 2, facilitated glucose transporter member 11-like isoform X2 n=1 Tax=Phyllobates terribilis TaxID=111132 RepID=UPI003CCA89DA